MLMQAPMTSREIFPRDAVDEAIALRLAAIGWCVVEDYFLLDDVTALRTEALEQWQTGCFRLATVGKDRKARELVRNDQILWLEPPYSGVQELFLARMEALRQAINRTLYMGLHDFECHYTRYAPGAYYQKHLDRFRADTRRAVSCILYLNADWQPSDGGMLRLYLETDGGETVHDVVPQAGTLACFLSDRIWHEVLPTRRERLSLTGWFRTCA